MTRKAKPEMYSQSELDAHESLLRGAPAKGISAQDCEEVAEFAQLLAKKASPPTVSCGCLVLAVKSANSDRMLDLSIPLCPKSVTTVAIGDIVEDVYTEDLLRAADTIRRHLDTQSS